MPEPAKSTSLIVRRGAQLTEAEWPDERIATIRKMIHPDAGTPELVMFLSVCQRYQLDPFLKEIWLVKAEGRLIVMTGRDAYLKAARRDEGFVGYDSGVVHENDAFEIIRDAEDVVVKHHIKSMDRGKLVGAYCVAYHKTRRPVVVVRAWSDYEHLWSDDRKKNWKLYGPDMIEARVLTAALRRQYQLSGLYVQEEFGEASAPAQANITDQLDSLADQIEVIEAEVVDIEEIAEAAGGEKESDSGGRDATLSEADLPPSSYPCEWCGKPYDSPQKLGGHKRHCKEKPAAPVDPTPSASEPSGTSDTPSPESVPEAPTPQESITPGDSPEAAESAVAHPTRASVEMPPGWKVFYDGTSERYLPVDPDGVYLKGDFLTRDDAALAAQNEAWEREQAVEDRQEQAPWDKGMEQRGLDVS